MHARPGDIVVGAANIPHKFLNVGDGRLEVICTHARLEEEAWKHPKGAVPQ